MTDEADHPDTGVEAASPGNAITDEAATESLEENPAPKPRGRFLGILGFLTGAAGLGLAGYLYYLLVYTDPQSAVDARLMVNRSTVVGLSTRTPSNSPPLTSIWANRI